MLMLLVVGAACLGIPALIIWLVVRSARLKRERMAAVGGLAHARGWTYAPRDDAWATRFSAPPFGLGHNRQAHNVVTGQWDGRGFVAMDYVYYTTETTSTGKGGSSTREVAHPYGVVAVNTGANFPQLSVTPEGAIGRFFGRLTNSDIELESEDFNRAFTVTCPNRRFASDLLHPQMMELLLREPNFAFVFDGASIITARPGNLPLAEIDARLHLLDAVIDRIPPYVWQNVTGG